MQALQCPLCPGTRQASVAAEASWAAWAWARAATPAGKHRVRPVRRRAASVAAEMNKTLPGLLTVTC